MARLRISGADCFRAPFAAQPGHRTTGPAVPRSTKESVHDDSLNYYRTPKKPGYLGGYNWRATCFGLLLLVVVNFAATQFIAARFEYQPALGQPLLRSKTGGIYEPFDWVIWGWHNSTSQDPRVRKPLFEGEMIVFAGSFLCVGIFFAADESAIPQAHGECRRSPRIRALGN